MWSWARTALLLFALTASSCEAPTGGTDAIPPLPTESPPPTASKPLDEVRVELLQPKRALQHRISDFPTANPSRRIAVTVSVRSNHDLDDNFREQLVDELKLHAPAPYELQLHRGKDRVAKPWGRLDVVYRSRLDRLRKHGKGPRRGRVKLRVELEPSIPKGYQSSWDAFVFETKLERNYEELLERGARPMDAFVDSLPGLVIFDEVSSDFPRQLDLRPELMDGKLSSVFRDVVTGVYRGGCATTSSDAGSMALFRLQNPGKAVRYFEPKLGYTIRCTAIGAYLVTAETNRSARIEFIPWTGAHTPWRARASFDRAIEVETLRFLLSGNTMCLVGEQEAMGDRYAKLQCYDVRTGAATWEWTEHGTDIEALTIRKGALALAAGRHLRVLDVETGERVWSAEIARATGITQGAGSCLLDDLFVFTPRLDSYMAFDMATRESPWELATFGGTFLYCDGAGSLYLDEAGGLLLAVNAEDVTPRWQFRVGGKVLDALYHGGFLFVLLSRALYVLESATGELAWQVALPIRARKLHRVARRLYVEGDNGLYELTRPDRL